MLLKISSKGNEPIGLLNNIYHNFCPTGATLITVLPSFRVSPKITWAIKFCSLLLAWVLAFPSFGQHLPVLKSYTYTISIRDGEYFRKGRWTIEPKVNPDIYEAPMAIHENQKLVTFITDVDSLQFRVERDKTYPFVILVNEKDSAFTQIKAVQAEVTFTRDYIKSHQGKTFVEIPAVYELVNIIIALTNIGRNKQGLVVKSTAYYQAVRNWFSQYETEPIVKKIDSVLAKSYREYFSIKMNAYAFKFSAKGKIVPTEVYDRLTSINTLRPFLDELQHFSDCPYPVM